MRFEGTITTWKDGEGYGFITPKAGGEDLFVHIKSLTTRNRRPREKDVVTYVLGLDGKGRLQAQQVEFANEYASPRRPSGRSTAGLIAIAAFFGLLAAVAFSGRLPMAIVGLYVFASVFTFVVYAIDKTAAIQGRWRVPESTLHFLSLIGGWPGAFVAQTQLRHKTKKLSFQIVFWITVFLNGGALTLALSPAARSGVQRLLESLRALS